MLKNKNPFIYGLIYVITNFLMHLLTVMLYISTRDIAPSVDFTNEVARNLSIACNLETILLGIVMLFLFFKGLKGNVLFKGIAVGIIWFSMLCVADLLMYSTSSGTHRLSSWILENGIYYLLIPVISGMLGYIIDKYRGPALR